MQRRRLRLGVEYARSADRRFRHTGEADGVSRHWGKYLIPISNELLKQMLLYLDVFKSLLTKQVRRKR